MQTTFLQVKDNASAVAVAGSLNNTTSPITISGLDTTQMPAVVNGYAVTIYDDVNYSDPGLDPNMEKALVTAVTINQLGSLTLTRPYAKSHTGSPRIALLLIAQHITDITGAINTAETKLDTIAVGATANDTDANLKNRANHTGTQLASTISDFATAADARVAAAAGVSIATLSGGLIPTSQLPAIALTSVQTAADLTSMLALTTQQGDVVVRTDESKTYMRNAGVTGTITDYTLLDTPPNVVASVNGQTGTVVLAKADVGLGNVDNTTDLNKPISTATQTALNGKAATAHTHNIADINATGTPDATTYLRGDGSWAAPAAGGGGGQTTVTKVVAPTGGDYTTLSAAIAAASSGWTIAVAPGTYTEAGFSTGLTNLTIIGAGAEAVTLNFGANSAVFTGTLIVVEEIGISLTTGYLGFQGTKSRLINCFIAKNAATGNCITMSGTNSLCANNRIDMSGTQTTGYALSVTGSSSRVVGNDFNLGSVNATRINFTCNYSVFDSNTMNGGSSSSAYLGANGARQVVSNNTFNLSSANPAINMYSSGENVISGNVIGDVVGGIDQVALAGSVEITGNYIKAGTFGIRCAGPANVISGNRVQQLSGGSGTGISLLTGSDYTVVCGNRVGHSGVAGFATGISIASGVNKAVVTGNSATSSTTPISDSGTATVNANNGI